MVPIISKTILINEKSIELKTVKEALFTIYDANAEAVDIYSSPSESLSTLPSSQSLFEAKLFFLQLLQIVML